MKGLVTGGAGFIGSTLVDRLLAEGWAVDVVDDLSSGNLANLGEARADRSNEISFHQIDICSAGVVELVERRHQQLGHLGGKPHGDAGPFEKAIGLALDEDHLLGQAADRLNGLEVESPL